ncbi:MAG: hypothetical protein ACK4IC_11445 [Erythrobacter sp.]
MEQVSEMFKACLSIAASGLALAAAAPLAAQTQDIGEFLAGHWGDADSNWQDQPADWIYAPCNIRHPRSTAAYEFSGKTDALTVRTTGRQGQSIRLTPVVSPVVLAGPFDPAQSPQFKSARAAFAITFARVGSFVPKERASGMLIVIDDDRMVLIEPNEAQPENPVRHYLVRCKNR